MKKKAISMSHISKAVLIATTFCIFSNQSFASAEVGPRDRKTRVSMYGPATAEAPSHFAEVEAAKKRVASAAVSGDRSGVEEGARQAQQAFMRMTPEELLGCLTAN